MVREVADHQDILRSLGKTVLVRLLAKKHVSNIVDADPSLKILCVDQQAYQGEDHVCKRDHEGAQQADKEVGANHQVTYSVIFNHY